MDIRLLGALEVVHDSGTHVALSGTRLQTLLAVLALRSGEVVSTDRLVDELWQDGLPARPANALQRQVSTLRGVLPTTDVVQWRGRGYRLAVDRTAIDVFRFEDLARRGDEARRGGDVDGASRLLAEGLALWRGEAFTGLPETGMLGVESRRLGELRIAATEARVEAELALGHHAAVIATLEQLVSEHPLHERFRAQLMLALSRAGRQADALRAYQSARDTMTDELGIEPSAELRTLELAILRQEAPAAGPNAHIAAPRPRTNLPAALTSLVGRDRERASLRRSLTDNRLVTVVGTGGAGKTRLAVETAREWLCDGDAEVSFVQLADVAAPDGVVPAIMTAFGLLRGEGEHEDVRRLVEFLCGRRLLLVLDDCEHLIAEVAKTVQHLLEACETLTVLVTSREALCITGEVLSPVPPLPLDDALMLFVQRGRAVVPTLPPYDPMSPDGRIMREVCERLDGLPLAIELAAARLRSTSLGELAAGLDDRFRLLNRGPRTARARHQTLRAVVDWSYDLLFEDERRVFDRLAVFAGGCAFDAARAVCADGEITPDDVTDLVTRLADKSLLSITHDAPTGTTRCTMLQTLLDYGRARLAISNDADVAYGNHLAYFAGLARRSIAASRGEDQRHWLRTVEADIDNIRAALEFAVVTGDAGSATTIAGALGWFWWFTGRAAEGKRWIERARDCAGAAATPGWPRMIGWSAFLSTPGFVLWAQPEDRAACSVGRNDLRDDLRALEADAVGRLREDGAVDELSMLQTALSVAYSTRGDHERAIALLTQAHRLLTSYEAVPWAIAMRHYVAGRRAFTAGDVDEADASFRKSIVHLDAIGAEVHCSFVCRYLGRLAVVRGDYQSSITHIEHALGLAESLDIPGFANTLLMDLADAYAINGDYDHARSALEGLLARARDLRSRRGISESLAALALVEFRRGGLERAAAFAHDGLTAAHALDHSEAMAHCLAVLGYVAEYRGELVEASERHGVVLSMARRGNDPRLDALALEGFAGIAMRTDNDREAARRFGAADALRRSPGQWSGWAFALHPRADRQSILDGLQTRAAAGVVEKEVAAGSAEPARVLGELVRAPVLRR